MNSSYFLHIFDTKPYGLPNLLEFLKGMDGLLDFGANFPPKFKLPAKSKDTTRLLHEDLLVTTALLSIAAILLLLFLRKILLVGDGLII